LLHKLNAMNTQTHAPATLRLGLTGGIGSGKSSVANLLIRRGAALVDADAIARSVTAAHGSAMPAIAKTFGADFVTPEGALDRDRMRAHVFDDALAKKRLESIIHPLVALETKRQAQAAFKAGHRTVVFDVPLLVESGHWRTQVDRVLVVDCLVETQIQRVMARNDLSREGVKKIIASQATREQRLATADWVIYNDALSFEALDQLVSALPIQPL
jgi:dephospho-CoA kinase